MSHCTATKKHLTQSPSPLPLALFCSSPSKLYSQSTIETCRQCHIDDAEINMEICDCGECVCSECQDLSRCFYCGEVTCYDCHKIDKDNNYACIECVEACDLCGEVSSSLLMSQCTGCGEAVCLKCSSEDECYCKNCK